ncbi:MAG: FKBP-type peptidyl-prolyl cis-trans isomerase [Pseudomonadales bacterium]|nr:FKBP-type peptidyl-prolyl cis-trans isomerase [Pseudomonadales bacterium]
MSCNNDQIRIDDDKQITLHFSVLFMDGSIVDSTRDNEPATFQYGDGSLLPGFEQALLGLKVGDKRSILIESANGFGERNDKNMQEISRSRFSDEMVLEPGTMISFANAGDGGELPGVVQKIENEIVTVDFNHPLAGRDLTFEVEIIAIKPAVQAVQMQGGSSREN